MVSRWSRGLNDGGRQAVSEAAAMGGYRDGRWAGRMGGDAEDSVIEGKVSPPPSKRKARTLTIVGSAPPKRRTQDI
eukprot:130326-Chlamydomonas_euryale.AAC.2